MTDPRRTRAYQQARTRFLNTHPPVCHWCGRDVYATAPKSNPMKATIDHMVEVDQAPHLAMDTSLWVVACLRCNSSRGSRYQSRRDAGQRDRNGSRNW